MVSMAAAVLLACEGTHLRARCWHEPKIPAGKTNLDEPVQSYLAHLLLITEGQFLLGHKDAVAAVELEVCPPAKSERTWEAYHGGGCSCSGL